MTPVERRRRRAPLAQRVPLSTAKAVVLIGCCALVVIPFLSVVSTSLADQRQITRAGGFVLWPEHPSLNAYRAVLNGGVVTRALLVSIGITVVGTVLSLIVITAMAYGLSRSRVIGRRPVLALVLVSLLFAPGIIPNYLMVKQLGLLNSYWAVILPTVVGAFNVIIVRSFIMGLPSELIESAKIDGASDIQVLVRIVLPLSRAVLAVVGLFLAVGYWNSFFGALLYLNDSAKWPLQLVLRTYVVNAAPLGANELANPEVVPPPQTIQMAIVVIALIPILLVYPFLQRHFTKGVLIGAVKG